MAITHITDYVIFGSTTDTKPLAGTPSQTLFFEIDTGRVYKFTGGVWSLFSGDNKTETLTNKTITLPVISSIKTSTGGTIALPSTSDTLVGRSTTDTLSNKTMISPTIATINNGGVITLPSGTRTLVARDTADTLLNKTINVNANTVTATSQAAGDLLVSNGTQFVRLARGSNGQLLQATATNIAWATVAGGGGGSTVTSTTALYTIYIESGTYKYRNNSTGVVGSTTSSTDAGVVFQAAIDAATFAGSIFVMGGNYIFTTTVNMKSGTKLVGEGKETTLLKAPTNAPIFIFGSTAGIQHCDVSDMNLYHAQSGYTSSLVRFTSNTRYNTINNCHFYASGFAAGNAISFENTAVANAGTGIIWNRILNCHILGFNNGILMSTSNGGSPINFINDNNFQNVSGEYCIRFLKCSGVATSDIVHNRFINCTFQSGTTAGGNAPAVVFDYDDSANHDYTVHLGCIAWDLPAGVKYANVNTHMGTDGMSLIGCVPVSTNTTTFIGGSGSGSTTIRTESAQGNILNTNNTWTGYNQFLLTAAGGFEDTWKTGINGSADYFSISNNTNASGSFSPIIRANQTSTNLDRFTPGLFFQSLLKPATDTADADPGIVFNVRNSDTTTVTNRPIAAFRPNLSVTTMWIYPSYIDLAGNQIRNAVMGGVRWNTTTKTANYTATDTDVIILCDTTSASITITLPAASGRAGKIYVIHRKAGTTNSITIDPNAAETIDGVATITVPTAAGSSKWIFCDGTSWYSK